MPQQQHNINASKEAQIQLALQALKRDANLSQRRAASIYRVPQATLSYRHAGRPSRADTMPNSRGLDDNEERVIVEHILELDARGFGPWLADVAAMANSLRAERNLGPVGTNWPSTFVKRQPELKVKFNRRYDYKQALCEDSGVVQGWFSLVANVKAKYGIPDDNVHNFDETGFMIGQISTGAVVTASERRGRPKTAIPPFIIFKARHYLTGWYKEEDLPQDWVVGVSSNGWTTNELSLEWLKHFDRHTKERTGGFRGARLVPFNPEQVISALDVKLRTPLPPLAANNVPWQSQTPSNTLELRSQSTLVKSRIQRHVDSSPTSMVKAFKKVLKGAAIIAHKLVLAQQEIRELRAANEAATRRKSHKRKRVQEEGTLIVEDGQRLAALKEFGARSDGKRAKKQVRAQEGHNRSGFGGGLAKVMRSPVDALARGVR
ncbi:hypothetical protein OPT61_g8643 [Boeremia exigua]|uniref:Uncharacterized protein n=1 Tax=Boeremia exigua TaxID=749465 RepID=A0ACC2HY06_9PLEO|nr:hypothetical protein OPT61_g8643 [Boeremia exigua]